MQNSWPLFSLNLQLEAEEANPESRDSRAALSQGAEPPHPLHFGELWGWDVLLSTKTLSGGQQRSAGHFAASPQRAGEQQGEL